VEGGREGRHLPDAAEIRYRVGRDPVGVGHGPHPDVAEGLAVVGHVEVGSEAIADTDVPSDVRCMDRDVVRPTPTRCPNRCQAGQRCRQEALHVLDVEADDVQPRLHALGLEIVDHAELRDLALCGQAFRTGHEVRGAQFRRATGRRTYDVYEGRTGESDRPGAVTDDTLTAVWGAVGALYGAAGWSLARPGWKGMD
jgi:hypothetical protein